MDRLSGLREELRGYVARLARAEGDDVDVLRERCAAVEREIAGLSGDVAEKRPVGVKGKQTRVKDGD